GRLLDIHSHTVQRVCRQYFNSRQTKRKPWLRWRGRKSLGWVPFNTGHVTLSNGQFVFRGKFYEVMHMRDIAPDAVIHAGSFNADSAGRWYINVTVEVPSENTIHSGGAVGIDLGLKDIAVLSTGAKINAPRLLRAAELKLGTMQRAAKTRRVTYIHRKVANRRKDFLHKVSNKITKEFGTIIVGDVSAARLVRSRMAKSVLDAGWTTFRNMLSYKAIARGGSFLEISETKTTQICSACGSLPLSRPE